MWFLNWIIQQLETAEELFQDAYYVVWDWIYPFNVLRHPLYGLYVVFFYLSHYFSEMNNWLVWLDDTINEFLSEQEIWQLFSDVIDYAVGAWNWVENSINNVTSIIENWWSSWLAWINLSIENLQIWTIELFNDTLSRINTVKVQWDNFRTVTLPTLNSSGLVATLIDSAFRDWLPFYDEMVSFIAEARDFANNPLDWIDRKIDNFFERYW